MKGSIHTVRTLVFPMAMGTSALAAIGIGIPSSRPGRR